MARNYKREYANYDGTPAVKKKRANRNTARRRMVKAGLAKKGDGKDVHHVDKNTKNIVSPKKQIDELVKQIPNSMKTADLNLDKFANLGFLVNIGEKFIENVEIDYRTNTSILIINGMPEMQFSIIKELAESFDVNVVDQDVEIVDKSASGQITISFRNG